MNHQDLIENWSVYEISYRQINGGLVVIVFDPKNDNRKILVESPWRKVSDQVSWAEILKIITTGDGKFSLNGGYQPPTITLRTIGVRHRDGISLIQAFVRRMGTCGSDVKGQYMKNYC